MCIDIDITGYMWCAPRKTDGDGRNLEREDKGSRKFPDSMARNASNMVGLCALTRAGVLLNVEIQI